MFAFFLLHLNKIRNQNFCKGFSRCATSNGFHWNIQILCFKLATHGLNSRGFTGIRLKLWLSWECVAYRFWNLTLDVRHITGDCSDRVLASWHTNEHRFCFFRMREACVCWIFMVVKITIIAVIKRARTDIFSISPKIVRCVTYQFGCVRIRDEICHIFIDYTLFMLLKSVSKWRKNATKRHTQKLTFCRNRCATIAWPEKNTIKKIRQTSSSKFRSLASHWIRSVSCSEMSEDSVTFVSLRSCRHWTLRSFRAGIDDTIHITHTQKIYFTSQVEFRCRLSSLRLTWAFVGCAPPWNSIVPYASVGWGRVCLFGNHASPGEPGSMPRMVGCVWRAWPQQHLNYSVSKCNKKINQAWHDSHSPNKKNNIWETTREYEPKIESSSICVPLKFNNAVPILGKLHNASIHNKCE